MLIAVLLAHATADYPILDCFGEFIRNCKKRTVQSKRCSKSPEMDHRCTVDKVIGVSWLHYESASLRYLSLLRNFFVTLLCYTRYTKWHFIFETELVQLFYQTNLNFLMPSLRMLKVLSCSFPPFFNFNASVIKH